jgi:plasmid stabilization system protein ParE
MYYQIHYVDEVENDIIQAKEWYKHHSEILEKRFVSAVKDALHKLEKYPTAFAIRYKHIRIIKTKVFPYNIYFYINNNDVIIIAVIHSKRDNKLATERIK